MGNLIDKLKESGNTLTETADYIEKGTKLASYWLDSEKRQQINEQAEYWRKKESHMIKTYVAHFYSPFHSYVLVTPKIFFNNRNRIKIYNALHTLIIKRKECGYYEINHKFM